MADEKPPETQEPAPTPRKVKGTRGIHLTVEQYEILAASYLASPVRSARALARETGVSLDTAIRAINLGWPHKQWAPLRERAKLHDARKNERTDAPALSPAELVDVRRFILARSQNLDIMVGIRATAARGLNRINDAMTRATTIRYGKRTRVIDVQVGKRTVQKVVTEDVELPPYLPHLASAARDLGQLAFGAGEQEKRWLKVEPPEGDAPMASGWEDMTDEQLDHVARTGKLPPGFTREGLRTKK